MSLAPNRKRGPQRDLHAMEAELHQSGFQRIAGVDEAGRGPLAGPVCAGMVVFEPGTRIPGVNDSKQLTHAQREELYGEITSRALAWSVGLASAAEIDRLNILRATHLAVQRALKALHVLPDFLLLDALRIKAISIPQESLVKGDSRSFSIAAASILAKVTRDRLIDRLALQFPGYGLDRHKGYGTQEHRSALEEMGPSTLHRQTFLAAWFDTAPPRPAEITRQLLQALLQDRNSLESRALLSEFETWKDLLPAADLELVTKVLRDTGR